MEMEIKVDLPFGWCRNCESRTLHEEKMLAGGEVYETWTTCENAPICEAEEKARTAETAGSATELRYTWCKGHQGCKTCEDYNRGIWPCCPITPPEEWIEAPRAIGYTCRHCGKTLATRRHKITERALFLRCPICNKITVIWREEAGGMFVRWASIFRDPYTEVAEFIEQWAKKNYYDDFAVTLRLDGIIVTTLLRMDEAANLEWADDWWKGQKDIQLIGFTPLRDLLCIGKPVKGNKNVVLTLSEEELQQE